MLGTPTTGLSLWDTCICDCPFHCHMLLCLSLFTCLHSSFTLCFFLWVFPSPFIFIFLSVFLSSLSNSCFSPQPSLCFSPPVPISAIISLFFISLYDSLFLSLPLLSLPHSFLSLTPSVLSVLFCSPSLGLSGLISLFPTFSPFLSLHPSLLPYLSPSPISTSSLPYFYLPLPFLPLFLTHVPLFPPVSSFVPPGISVSLYLLISPVSFSVLYLLPTRVVFSLSIPLPHLPILSACWRPGPCLPLQEVEGLLSENEMLQAKLHSQEEDFRLQNSTLMAEFSKVPGIAEGGRSAGLEPPGQKVEGS